MSSIYTKPDVFQDYYVISSEQEQAEIDNSIEPEYRERFRSCMKRAFGDGQWIWNRQTCACDYEYQGRIPGKEGKAGSTNIARGPFQKDCGQNSRFFG